MEFFVQYQMSQKKQFKWNESVRSYVFLVKIVERVYLEVESSHKCLR